MQISSVSVQRFRPTSMFDDVVLDYKSSGITFPWKKKVEFVKKILDAEVWVFGV